MLLIIAGFDPSGQAGLLVDSQIAQTLKVPKRFALTSNTLQNTDTFVKSIPTQGEIFQEQLELLSQKERFSSLKIGFLGSLAIAQKLEKFLIVQKEKNPALQVVLDPVLVGKKSPQTDLFRDDLAGFYLKNLCPLSTVITPNYPEACKLLKIEENSLDLETLAQSLSNKGKTSVFIARKNPKTQSLEQVFFNHPKQSVHLENKTDFFPKNSKTIGLGCRFSTLTACYLSQNHSLEHSLNLAQTAVLEGFRP